MKLCYENDYVRGNYVKTITCELVSLPYLQFYMLGQYRCTCILIKGIQNINHQNFMCICKHSFTFINFFAMTYRSCNYVMQFKVINIALSARVN